MILNLPRKLWGCGNCETMSMTQRSDVHTEFHNCPGMGGLSVPMVEEGVRAKVSVNDREDYVNGDNVQVDGNGRPVMSITVEREDGIDCAVYAPTASSVATPKL